MCVQCTAAAPSGFRHGVGGACDAIRAAVLRWVSRCQASITQPVKSHTSSPVVSTLGARRRARGGIPSRFGTSRNRCPRRSPSTRRAEPDAGAAVADRTAATRGSSDPDRRVLSVSVPSAPRTAPHSGMPSRSLGTARRSPRSRRTRRRSGVRSARRPAWRRCDHGASTSPHRHPERRTVRQTQTAADASRQQLAVEPEHRSTGRQVSGRLHRVHRTSRGGVRTKTRGTRSGQCGPKVTDTDRPNERCPARLLQPTDQTSPAVQGL